MGYTTDFEGRFDIDRPLAPEHLEFLKRFSETRRMARDAEALMHMADPVRTSVGLPIGQQGAYFIGAEREAGDLFFMKDATVLNYNEPPKGQPGLWCDWVPSEDGRSIVWNGGDKFYNYAPWLVYVIEHFLGPWGYVLDGVVTWQGEDPSDVGDLVVVKNTVIVRGEPGA